MSGSCRGTNAPCRYPRASRVDGTRSLEDGGRVRSRTKKAAPYTVVDNVDVLRDNARKRSRAVAGGKWKRTDRFITNFLTFEFRARETQRNVRVLSTIVSLFQIVDVRHTCGGTSVFHSHFWANGVRRVGKIFRYCLSGASQFIALLFFTFTRPRVRVIRAPAKRADLIFSLLDCANGGNTVGPCKRSGYFKNLNTNERWKRRG